MARASTAASTGESSETRRQIIAAALEAFTEKGFDGATTRAIAKRVGVNHGLIPYYFGSKEKLWQAAVDLAFGEMQQGIEGALADPTLDDDRERAARVIRAYVRFVADHPEFVRLMHEEGKRRGPRMRWIVDRHVKPLYQAVSTLLERVRSAGDLRFEIAPIHFFYVLAGAGGLMFHQAEECRRLTGIDPFDGAVVEEHARVIEMLLLGPDSQNQESDS